MGVGELIAQWMVFQRDEAVNTCLLQQTVNVIISGLMALQHLQLTETLSSNSLMRNGGIGTVKLLPVVPFTKPIERLKGVRLYRQCVRTQRTLLIN